MMPIIGYAPPNPRPPAPPRPHAPGPEALTPGQLRVIREIAAGCSAKEAAARLYLSVCTVRAHQYAAFERLGITRQAELIHWAIVHGVVIAGGAQ